MRKLLMIFLAFMICVFIAGCYAEAQPLVDNWDDKISEEHSGNKFVEKLKEKSEEEYTWILYELIPHTKFSDG